MTVVLNIVQVVALLAIAPLLRGVIGVAKARLQGRRGASIFRPYTDLAKLWRKEQLVPPGVSPLFRFAPIFQFAAIVLAACAVPLFHPGALLSHAGNFVLLAYLLALGRFFLVLGALDTGSSFEGLGTSREMMVAALAEAPLLLGLTSVAILARSSNLSEITAWTLQQNVFDVSAVHILALTALAIVGIAETGRVPVDNPTTHLELTMIHEAMVLDYSGPDLALIEWSAAAKLGIVFSLLIAVFAPWGMAAEIGVVALAVGAIVFLLKMLALAVLVAVLESSVAKMRMYAVPDFLGVAGAVAILAIVFTVLGRP